VRETVDPLGGSYYVEDLTNRLERGALQVFADIEARGGMIACIESGWVAAQIHESAYRTQLQVERGEKIVVGVNKYHVEEPRPALFSVDPQLEDAQKERLGRWKSGRSEADVSQSLAALESAAQGDTNLMPFIVAAVRAEATLGEISDILRRVFGTFDT
jgi:methylmalonyl-CoA mutase N-terminal domain/subunit